MNANETKSETKVETGRPWWEVDGFEQLSEDEREIIREDSNELERLVASGDLARIIGGFERANTSVDRLRKEAREALVRYRVFQRYVEAVRQRLRGTPRSDGSSAADAIAAGSRHRGNSSGGGSGAT